MNGLIRGYSYTDTTQKPAPRAARPCQLMQVEAPLAVWHKHVEHTDRACLQRQDSIPDSGRKEVPIPTTAVANCNIPEFCLKQIFNSRTPNESTAVTHPHRAKIGQMCQVQELQLLIQLWNGGGWGRCGIMHCKAQRWHHANTCIVYYTLGTTAAWLQGRAVRGAPI